MVVLLLAEREHTRSIAFVSQGRCSFNARNRGSTIPSLGVFGHASPFKTLVVNGG